MNAKLRTAIGIIGFFLLSGTLAVMLTGTKPTGADRPAVSGVPGGVRLSVVVSPEPGKQQLLRSAVAAFNAGQPELGGGRITAAIETFSDQEAISSILSGDLKPQVWMPASSLQGQRLNAQAGRELAPLNARSVMSSPVVVGTWHSVAAALKARDPQIGWRDLARLAGRPTQWQRIDVPAYGSFKLLQPSPERSTTGLLSMVAQYRASGKDVPRLQRQVVQYTDDVDLPLQRLGAVGPAFGTFLPMQEADLIAFNAQARGERLHALYPEDGTMIADHPAYAMNGPWSASVDQIAASRFLAFLDEYLTPARLARSGFRAPDGTSGIVADGRVDPASPAQPLTGVFVDDAEDAIARWRMDRKKANIIVLVDNSAAMAQTDLPALRVALREGLFAGLSTRDRVGLSVFAERYERLAGVKDLGVGQANLEELIDSRIPQGEPDLVAGIDGALTKMGQIADADRFNIVLVVSGPTGEEPDVDAARRLTDRLTQQTRESGAIRVITISYQQAVTAPKAGTLESFARASGGASYAADASSIKGLLQRVAAAP